MLVLIVRIENPKEKMPCHEDVLQKVLISKI